MIEGRLKIIIKDKKLRNKGNIKLRTSKAKATIRKRERGKFTIF